MYIPETTAAERLIIENTVYDLFAGLDRALRLLHSVWEQHFDRREQKDIQARDAEDIENHLYIATGMIFDILTQYALTMGDSDFRGVAPYLDSSRRAEAAIRTNEVIARVTGLERRNGAWSTEQQAAVRKAMYALPDEEAAPLLESLAARAAGAGKG